MKKLFLLGMLALMASPAWAEHQSADVSVKGMVCSFCAQGIQKKFSSEEAVSKVDVSLEKHHVKLTFVHGQEMSDQKIAQLLTESGYSVESISRNP